MKPKIIKKGTSLFLGVPLNGLKMLRSITGKDRERLFSSLGFPDGNYKDVSMMQICDDSWELSYKDCDSCVSEFMAVGFETVLLMASMGYDVGQREIITEEIQ